MSMGRKILWVEDFVPVFEWDAEMNRRRKFDQRWADWAMGPGSVALGSVEFGLVEEFAPLVLENWRD